LERAFAVCVAETDFTFTGCCVFAAFAVSTCELCADAAGGVHGLYQSGETSCCPYAGSVHAPNNIPKDIVKIANSLREDLDCIELPPSDLNNMRAIVRAIAGQVHGGGMNQSEAV
jgi:hypothetical protein